MDARLAVASWLDEADLKALSLVNKDSLAFARCDVLWKPLYLRRYGDCRPGFAVPPAPPQTPSKRRARSSPHEAADQETPPRPAAAAEAGSPVESPLSVAAATPPRAGQGGGGQALAAGRHRTRAATVGTTVGFLPRPSRVEPDLAALATTEAPGGVSWFEHARRRYLSPLAGDTVQVLWDGAFNLVEGERVRSYSGRGWWDASVVRKDAGGRFLVHYLRCSCEAAAAEAASRRDACVAEAHRRWPWLARSGAMDPSRGPTAADADALAQMCADGEARRDCEGLPDLRPGDVVELRCVSSLGRSPWLETVVDAVVPMEWSRRALTPDVEAAVIEQLELWLEACEAEAERRRSLGEDAPERPASPFAATPSPLAALAPRPVAVSGRGRPTGHAQRLAAPERGSAIAPPSAVQRRAVVPAMGAVSLAGLARQPSLNGAGVRAAASAAVARISGTPIPRKERDELPFGTVAFRVGQAVMDEDNRLVARHRLRLLRRGPSSDSAGAAAARGHARCGLGCAASPGAAASRPTPAPQEGPRQGCVVM
ncbi:hypothetical protein FNF31_07898 [Cafeteria roenbergensis]|uniref:Uncharacterized protein n=1 Tax=Cafeteria roenbergensis TaxID=33653 RepID=A0A5A8BZ90_CAFRO|nr:hypothetical protein FNF31_07898 [Cafeteria roenbergensis]KAA0167006.1 hypothetical protein FNF28_02929 [Cafeteria roenbergensis]